MMSDRVKPAARWSTARHRRAMSLVEVLGTLAVLLVVAVSAASILAAITNIGTKNSRSQQGRMSVERLAKTFRHDVHDTSDIVLSGDRGPIELTNGAITIRYEWDDQPWLVLRTVSEGKKRRAIDRFELPDHCDPRVSTSDQLVTVVLSDVKPRQPWVIEASQ